MTYSDIKWNSRGIFPGSDGFCLLLLKGYWIPVGKHWGTWSLWVQFDVIKYKSAINMLITMIFSNYVNMTCKSINNIQITKIFQAIQE